MFVDAGFVCIVYFLIFKDDFVHTKSKHLRVKFLQIAKQPQNLYTYGVLLMLAHNSIDNTV